MAQYIGSSAEVVVEVTQNVYDTHIVLEARDDDRVDVFGFSISGVLVAPDAPITQLGGQTIELYMLPPGETVWQSLSPVVTSLGGEFGKGVSLNPDFHPPGVYGIRAVYAGAEF